MSLRKHSLRALSAGVVPVVCIALAGCGGSKPGFCADRANLESSVKGLGDLSLSSGPGALEAQLNKIKTDATALVKSAKSDFPNETAAIRASLDKLTSSVKALPSSPSAGDIATIATDASQLVTSVRTFLDTTGSKCR